MARTPDDTQVIAPRQARSRATMERIVAVAEELLAHKPFEQVTIAEISSLAGCAPTAIYARFTDKTALLLEVHERFKERTLAAIASTFADPARRDWSDVEFVTTATRELVALQRSNAHLLRSVLLADNAAMYRRAADLTRGLSLLLCERLLGPEPVDPDPVREGEARSLDFRIRAALAVLQQDLLFGDATPARYVSSEEELARQLSALVLNSRS